MPHVLYAPGTWLAIVAPNGLVVLPADAPSALVDDAGDALESGRGLSGVLESLTGAYGTSLADLPPFAVVITSGSEARLAVRGALSIDVTEADAAPLSVSGAGITTWSERLVHGASRLLVTAAPTSAPDAVADAAPMQWLGIRAGTVLAAAVRVDLTPAGAAHAPDTATTYDTATKFVTTSAPDREATPTRLNAVSPESTPASEAVLSANEIEPIQPHSIEDTRTDIPEEAYDHLWGETVVKSVESAAVREVDEDDDDDESDASAPATPVAPAPTATPGAPSPQPSTLASPSSATPSPAPEPPAPSPAGTTPAATPAATPPAPADWTAPPATGLIDRVPGFSAAIGAPAPAAVTPASPASAPTPPAPPGLSAATPAPPAPASVPDIDHDGLTITVSEVDALRRLAEAGQSDSVTGTGTGPDADAADASTTTPGTLRLSTGDTVTLDRTVIIGRRPRANRVDADRLPTLVTVPSPEQDISRNHLEVRIEGRHVLAVDLATTNGSVLHRDGTPPARLTPNEAVLVLEGDLIDIGDGVTVTFEGLL